MADPSALLSKTTRSILALPFTGVPIPSAAGVEPPQQKEVEDFEVLSTKWLVKLYSGKQAVDQSSRKALVDGFLKSH